MSDLTWIKPFSTSDANLWPCWTPIPATGIVALSFECLVGPWCSLGSQVF